MTKNEYIKRCIKNNLHLDSTWIISVFSTTTETTEYINLEDNTRYDNEAWSKLDDDAQPLFTSEDTINLTPDDMLCIKSNITTKVYRMLLNAIIIEYPFNGSIEYINEELNISAFADNVLPSKLISADISVDDVNNLTSATAFLSQFGGLFVTSTTERVLLPPPDSKAFIKELKAKYIKKYGDTAFEDYTIIGLYKDELAAYDKKYLKEDADKGVTGALGKKETKARLDYFLTRGADKGLSTDPKAIMIEDSLEDGLSKDPVQLAAQINTLRGGYFSRGSETQEAGVLAAILIRSLHPYVINVDDCGDKVGISVTVEKSFSTALTGMYLITGGQSIKIVDGSKLAGTTVTLRSPMKCVAKGYSYCKKCMGDTASLSEGNIPLMASAQGGQFLNAKLKKMHVSGIPVTTLNPLDMIT